MGLSVPPKATIRRILALIEEHSELNGAEVLKLAPELHRSTVYTTLDRLEAVRALQSSEECGTSKRTRPLRIYSLTEFGVGVLRLSEVHDNLEKD